MFAVESDKNRADFLIGATIRPDTLNLCSSVSGEKGDMLIDVEWQIFDRAAQKVVATATTRGSGELLKFENGGMIALWNKAFVSALDALIELNVVQSFTGVPVPPELPVEASAEPKPAAG